MKNKLTYFVARDSMFGMGFCLIFQNAGKEAWISAFSACEHEPQILEKFFKKLLRKQTSVVVGQQRVANWVEEYGRCCNLTAAYSLFYECMLTTP